MICSFIHIATYVRTYVCTYVVHICCMQRLPFLWLAEQRPAGVKVRGGWPKQADGLHKDEQILVLFY